MTTIVQLDLNDLKPIIKDYFKESIKEINNSNVTEEKPDKCFLSDAAEITGLKKSAIYQLTFKNKIPYKKFGTRLIFSRKELQAWFDSSTIRKPTADKIISDRLKANLKNRNHQKRK